MYKYCVWDEVSSQEQKALLQRSYIDMAGERNRIAQIIEDVKERKEEAITEYSKQFDHCDLSNMSLQISEKEIAEAEKALSQDVIDALDLCMDHVRTVCTQSALPSSSQMQPVEGVRITHSYHPISSVGLYVPHGRGSFPSMTYMQTIPAHIAGVPRIVMVTPPEADGRINPACLYVAAKSGVHEIYRVGGVHSIALLAFGTDAIAPVDKIMGPGSVYVSMAKQIVSSQVDVGTVTGPSESMIIADDNADAQTIVADLLIEAEHGSDSMSVLLTPSRRLAQAVCEQLASAIAETPSPRKEFLSSVFSQKERVIVSRNLEQAIKIAELFAPEHLQLNIAEPEKWYDRLHHAGEILVGRFTPFSIANYATGANAILPTGGFAKTASALSVLDFLRSCSRVELSRKGYEYLRKPVMTLAEYEGFHHHAAALRKDRQ